MIVKKKCETLNIYNWKGLKGCFCVENRDKMWKQKFNICKDMIQIIVGTKEDAKGSERTDWKKCKKPLRIDGTE